MWQAFIILMICVMRWTISPIMRTAAADDALNRICRARGFPSGDDRRSLADTGGRMAGNRMNRRMIRELLHKKHYDADGRDRLERTTEDIRISGKKGILREKPFARQSEACTVTIFRNAV